MVHHKTDENFKTSFFDRNQHGPPEIPPFFFLLKPAVPVAFTYTTLHHEERPTNATLLWQRLTYAHAGCNLQKVNIKRRQTPA